MKIAKQALFVGSLTLLMAASAAHAQFKLPAALGGIQAANMDTDAAAAHDSLVQTFIASQTEVMAAQEQLALAYDLKDQAALLASEQQALASGGVKEASQLQTSLDVSSKANEEIASKQAQQATLSEEGKKYYAASLPHFAKGVLGTRMLIGEAAKFGSFGKSIVKSRGLGLLGTGVGKLKAGAFVAKATPAYSKQVFDAFRKTVSIGQSNGVKVPADATQALSGLE